jgi:hydroxyacylglutathione hydrolase
MIHVQVIPTLQDNLSYVIWSDISQTGWAVDPGEAAPIAQWLLKNRIRLAGILNTHHHHDHVGGNLELSLVVSVLDNKMPLSILCSKRDLMRVPGASRGLKHGEEFELFENDPSLFQIISIPGHTEGQIAYYSSAMNWIFVGDTVFRHGCGRIFEGTPRELFHSLERISKLPDETMVFFGHEYTENNVRFSQKMDPVNFDMYERSMIEVSKEVAKKGFATAPTLEIEKQHNLFLQMRDPAARARVSKNFESKPAQQFAPNPEQSEDELSLEVWTELRRRRN